MALAASPVTSIRTFKNILFATDFSECSSHALSYAAELARRFEGQLYLWHVVTPSQLAVGAPEAAPFLYDAARQNSRRELADIARWPELKDLKVTALLSSGIFDDELAQTIESHSIDLVVVGTHGRTGLRRLLLGSSAENVCRTARCPVLTIGPDLVFDNPVEFRNILFPTDLSETSLQALPFITQIARKFNATVTVLHTIPLKESRHGAQAKAWLARAALQRTFRREFQSCTMKFVVDFGDAAESILRLARERSADLIAMGVKDSFGFGSHLRSSIAYQVMVSASCPVLTCR